MNNYRKTYNRIKQYYLYSGELSQEEFHALYFLNDNEVQEFFSLSKYKIKQAIYKLGLAVEYQKYKKNSEDNSFIKVSNNLDIKFSLWSNVVGIVNIPHSANIYELGLLLLKELNKKQAYIWSIRLKMKIIDEQISISNHSRLKVLITKIIQS